MTDEVTKLTQQFLEVVNNILNTSVVSAQAQIQVQLQAYATKVSDKIDKLTEVNTKVTNQSVAHLTELEELKAENERLCAENEVLKGELADYESVEIMSTPNPLLTGKSDKPTSAENYYGKSAVESKELIEAQKADNERLTKEIENAKWERVNANSRS